MMNQYVTCDYSCSTTHSSNENHMLNIYLKSIGKKSLLKQLFVLVRVGPFLISSCRLIKLKLMKTRTTEAETHMLKIPTLNQWLHKEGKLYSVLSFTETLCVTGQARFCH